MVHITKKKCTFGLCRNWQNLELQGLVLGKVSPVFLKKTVPILYDHLKKLAEGFIPHLDNLKAFYQLLLLSTLEFSEPGVVDMVQYLSWLQNLAGASDFALTTYYRCALHAIVAGVLYLISKISSAISLQEHIMQVIEIRKSSAPHLLPDELFTSEERPDGVDDNAVPAHAIDKKLLFILNQEELLRKSPEPRKGFGKLQLDSNKLCFNWYSFLGKFVRDSASSGPDLTSHFSVSLDYGSDFPLSVDQISFNSLKEKALSGEEVVEVEGANTTESGTNGSLSFQEAVGKSCNSVRLISVQFQNLTTFCFV